MHMMENYLKSMNTKSDEKVYCFLLCKVVYCCMYMYGVRCTYFQLLKEFQENWHYCAYELGVHAFLKSDLIVEVMYNGKDITFLGPHVCYTCTYSIMETFVNS